MSLYQDQFSKKHNYPKVNMPSKILIIASTGRCGSHMLGHALHKTHKFGFPLEYANMGNLKEWERLLKVNGIEKVIAELQSLRTSPNGVFGIKIHYSHIKHFGGFENLLKIFPDAYYIILSRKDVLKQAISLSIANQTGVWISGQKPKNNNPTYDFKQIDYCLRNIILDNSSWRYMLASNNCNFIEMDFDSVRDNLSDSITRIANFIGCKIEKTDIPLSQATKKQSNQINIEWENRFLLEKDKNKELLNVINDTKLTKLLRKIKQSIN